MTFARNTRCPRESVLFSAAVCLALGACTLEPGGPEYAQLSLYAQNERGLVTEDTCTTLPVLPGGLTVRKLEFGSSFSATLEAERETLELRFEGVRAPDDFRRRLPAERLRRGYAEELTLETLSGQVYSVFLRAPCTEGP